MTNPLNVFEITIQRRAGGQAPVVVQYRQSGGLPVRNEGRRTGEIAAKKTANRSASKKPKVSHPMSYDRTYPNGIDALSFEIGMTPRRLSSCSKSISIWIN